MAGPENNCCVREQIKFALYKKFREPRLYSFASKGEWEQIPQRCKTNPREAKFIHHYPPSDTALHQILRFPRLDGGAFDCETSQELQLLKVDAICALLEANRNAASTVDSLGRSPLHLACMDICSSEVVAVARVVEAWPRACALQDLEGRTPLHYLVARNDDIPISFLVRIVKEHPEAVNMTDMVGETPIQILESRGGEVNSVGSVMHVLKTGEAPT